MKDIVECENNLIRFCKEILININSVRTRVRPGPWTEEMRYGIGTQRTAKGSETSNQERTEVSCPKEEGGERGKRKSGSKNENIVS